MNSIGGYNQFEIQKGKEYHCKEGILRLNTGRNALELCLRIRGYSKLYIPYYVCDAVLEIVFKLKLKYEFYSINKDLEPVFDYNRVSGSDGFLYVNYFGVKDKFVDLISKRCRNIIIDNSQAFFSHPLKNIDTFYSCRKFFGVPDGAYLYLENAVVPDFPQDVSVNRCTHLLKRIEFCPEAGFEDYKNNENSLIGQPIKLMSTLTTTLLKGIDYEYIKKKRLSHFLFLNNLLHKYNKIAIKQDHISSPLVYPFLSDMVELRERLIKQKIYVAHYWPNIKQKLSRDNIVEKSFCSKLCSLPICQNLCHADLNFISGQILCEIKDNNS